MDRLPFLLNLNGLRFLAASFVIGFHFFSFPNILLLNNFFANGHIAVPFFFLLSGFILYYNYFTHEFKIKKYWISRFIRLAPIYYMAMFCALPMLYMHQQNSDYSLVQKAFYFLSNLTLTQSLFVNHKLLSFWNIHSWSLSVEMFLYLCSPFIIMHIRKLSLTKTIVLLAIMFTINTLIYFSFQKIPGRELLLKNHFAPMYLFTFINGCLVSKIYIERTEFFKKVSSLLFVFSFVLLVSSFIFNLPKGFYSTFNPFYQVFFSTLILGSCHQNVFNKWLGIPLFILLGDASYAMYIFQAPIKLFTQQFLYKVIGYQYNTGLIFCLIIFSAITIVSVIVSKYIDPAIRKKMHKLLIRK